MIIEQMNQDPSRLLFRSPIGLLGTHSLGKDLRKRSDALVEGGNFKGGFAGNVGGPRNVLALGLGFGSQLLQPAAKRMGGQAVVLVVALDLGLDVRVDRRPFAEFE